MIKLTEVKKEINEAIRKELRKNEKADLKVIVRIYEDEEDLYNVEIGYLLDGGFQESWFDKIGFEMASLKEAEKRSKTVLTTVKGWFKYSDIIVGNEIEKYHC